MLLTVLIVAVSICAGHAQPHGAESLETRIESRAAECNWIPRNRRDECPNEPPMENDVLKRRQSGLLAEPGNQGTCGCCWAFAATHTLTDRLSVSMDHQVPLIAPQDITTCINDPDIPNGCCGGSAPLAYDHIKDPGTVMETCRPYSEGGYAYNPALDSDQQETQLVCNHQCANRNMSYSRSSFGIHGYKKLTTVAEMMAELENGPISAAFLVTDEFKQYACGIFCPGDDRDGEGHAVEIVDYGTENGVDYWVVKNSWGREFGEKGYFRIRRGQNDLTIETRRVHAPIVSETDETPQSNSNPDDLECAPLDIKTQDEDVQRAALFVVNSLRGRISCSTAHGMHTNANIIVENVDKAMCQIVAGDLFTLTINAELEGCSDDAYIIAQVYVDLDKNQELLNYEYIPVYSPSTDSPSNTATANSITPVMYLFVLFVGVVLHYP